MFSHYNFFVSNSNFKERPIKHCNIEHCHSIAMQYRNIATRVLRHIAAIL